MANQELISSCQYKNKSPVLLEHVAREHGNRLEGWLISFKGFFEGYHHCIKDIRCQDRQECPKGLWRVFWLVKSHPAQTKSLKQS